MYPQEFPCFGADIRVRLVPRLPSLMSGGGAESLSIGMTGSPGQK
jgi:hypothetical protein